MLKRIFVFSSAVFLGLASATAANADSYVTVDALNWTFDQTTGTTGKASGTGIRLVYGANLSDNFGWEGHLGFGGSGDTGTGLGTISNDALAGFFMRGNAVFGDTSLYGLLGFTSARFSNAVSTTVGSGVSYGFGVQYNFSDNMGVHADYINYVDNGNWSATATSFGINFNF